VRNNEHAKLLLISMGITLGMAFLFYRSFWGMLLLPFVYLFVKYRFWKNKKEKELSLLEEHFMNGLQVLNTALQAGLSMENAWREVEKETKSLYGEGGQFYHAIREMNQAVSLNTPVEQLFYEFAHESKVEEMVRFAEILDYGKRSGGNWRRIIDQTVLRICEKYETQKEIEVMLAAKKMEQQVMNIVPLGMILFLQLASWDYVKVLYHNWLGVICMTVCLGVYVLAILLSEKIMKIQV